MIPTETLKKLFKDTESLLNVKDGVTVAASNDDRLRTVKNINSSYPLIVAPNTKNRNILECKCKSSTWYNLCFHSVAILCDTGISFNFFSEIKKEIYFKGKKRGLIKTLESDLTDKEKRMKQDETAKKITRGKIKNKHHLINHNLLLCVLILQQAFTHHQI